MCILSASYHKSIRSTVKVGTTHEAAVSTGKKTFSSYIFIFHVLLISTYSPVSLWYKGLGNML
jgi:hypothetical protein